MRPAWACSVLPSLSPLVYSRSVGSAREESTVPGRVVEKGEHQDCRDKGKTGGDTESHPEGEGVGRGYGQGRPQVCTNEYKRAQTNTNY